MRPGAVCSLWQLGSATGEERTGGIPNVHIQLSSGFSSWLLFLRLRETRQWCSAGWPTAPSAGGQASLDWAAPEACQSPWGLVWFLNRIRRTALGSLQCAVGSLPVTGEQVACLEHQGQLSGS